jgi:hypothetical protein
MRKRNLANPADKQEIVERLAKIQSSSPRLWGKMTAPQMICHLADSFRVTMGEKPWETARVSVTPIPMPDWFVKWVALDAPLRWPRGTPTRPKSMQKEAARPQAPSKAMCGTCCACWTTLPGSPETSRGNHILSSVR